MGKPVNELWRILGLKPGEDYLPDRDPPLLTDAGASKIREAAGMWRITVKED